MRNYLENLATMCRGASTQLEKLIATTDCPALVAAHGALVTKLADTDAHAAIQSLPLKGRTKDRNAVFTKTWDAAFIVAGLVRACASTNRQHDLAAKVRITRHTFERVRLRRSIELAQQITMRPRACSRSSRTTASRRRCSPTCRRRSTMRTRC